MNADNQRIDPCPFCGADAVLRYEGLGIDAAYDSQPYGLINCSEGRFRCCPELQFEPNPDAERAAIAEWNTRALVGESDLVERLASLAHEQWTGWMDYMFKACLYKGHGMEGYRLTLPTELANRWLRQMGTAYAELPEDERGSDRIEARRMIDVFKAL